MHKPGEQHLHYNIKKWKGQGIFNIHHEISENVVLVQFIDSVGNVNHEVSLVHYYIFEFNNKNELPLKIYSLNFVCSSFVGEGLNVRFETVFYAFRYINNTGKPNITD